MIPETKRPGQSDVYVSAGQPEGSAPRRPRGRAHRADHPEGPRGADHPHPGARAAAAWSGATRATAGSAATSCPSTSGCSTSSSSRPATKRERRRGRWSRPRSRDRPRPRETRSGRVSEVLGRLEDPGVDLKVVMAKYGAPRRLPGRGGGRGGRASRVRSGPRTSRVAPTSGPWPTVTVDPETARDHDDAISLDRTAERPLAAGGSHRRRGPLRPRRVARWTRRPTCAARRSTSPTAWCPCCPTPCRATSAASWKGRTGSRRPS